MDKDILKQRSEPYRMSLVLHPWSTAEPVTDEDQVFVGAQPGNPINGESPEQMSQSLRMFMV